MKNVDELLHERKDPPSDESQKDALGKILECARRETAFKDTSFFLLGGIWKSIKDLFITTLKSVDVERKNEGDK